MNILSRENADHYKWGNDNDGWHLLNNPDVSVIEERVSPGEEENYHRHIKSRQLFYILSGEALFRLENETDTLKAGDSLHIPPGKAHQIRNNSSEDLRFLVISTPHAHGDRELV